MRLGVHWTSFPRAFAPTGGLSTLRLPGACPKWDHLRHMASTKPIQRGIGWKGERISQRPPNATYGRMWPFPSQRGTHKIRLGDSTADISGSTQFLVAHVALTSQLCFVSMESHPRSSGTNGLRTRAPSFSGGNSVPGLSWPRCLGTYLSTYVLCGTLLRQPKQRAVVATCVFLFH